MPCKMNNAKPQPPELPSTAFCESYWLSYICNASDIPLSMDAVSMLQAEAHAVLAVNSRVRFTPHQRDPALASAAAEMVLNC